MKTIHFFTFFCFFILSCGLRAQSYYQNIHSKSGHYQKGQDVIPVGDDLTFVANTSYYAYEFMGQQWDWQYGFQICKTDQDGNLLWDKLYSAQYADLYSSSIQPTSDDGYVVAGNLYHTGNYFGYNYYPFLLKTDSQGQQQWLYSIYHAPAFSGPLLNYQGGSFSYAEQNWRGNYIAIGESTYSNNSGNSKTYLSLVEVGSTGNYINRQRLIEFDRNARGIKIHSIGESGYIAVAELSDFSGQYNSTVLMRLDADLGILWQRELREDSFAVSPRDLVFSSESKIMVAGNLINNKNRIFLAEFNLNGDLQWFRDLDFNGEETSLWLKSLDDDGVNKFYLFGDVESTPIFGSTQRDVFTIVCNYSGDPVDGKLYGKQNRYESFGGGVSFSNGDHVGVGEVNEGHAYIVKANAAGESSCDFYQIYPEKTAVDVEITELSFTEYSYAMFDAKYMEETHVNYWPNIANCPLFSFGLEEEQSFGKLESQTVLSSTSEVFPNPSAGRFTISLGADFSGQETVQARLLNLQGQLVRSFEWVGKKQELSLDENLKGVYLLQLQQGTVLARHKIILH